MNPVVVVIPGHTLYNEYLYYTGATRFHANFILKLAVESAILRHSLVCSSGLDEAIADEVSEHFSNPLNGLITQEQKFQLDSADQKTAEVLWAPIVTELNSVIDVVLEFSKSIEGLLQHHLTQDFFTDTYEVLGAMFYSGFIHITFGVRNVY